MNEFINGVKGTQNQTYTENGAGALKSTGNTLLDAFGSLGAMRFSSDNDIIRVFSAAFADEPELAMRMLFYMRDIRAGQGARKVFRVIIKWLAETEPKYIINNLQNFLFYGRGDDMLCLLDTSIKDKVIEYAWNQLRADYINFKAGKDCSLLAKWMPSENATSKDTKRYARVFIEGFKTTPRKYRIMLTALRKYLNVVERKMSAREWSNINYGTVPAKAALRYADAFAKHDEDGYINYLEKVAMGECKVNAGSLYPVDVIHKVMESYRKNISRKDRVLLNAMWNSLPNYLEGKTETGICVVDTSGSMSGTPIEVALSLGMYCADKCNGPFKNHFITFSNRPNLIEFKGADIVEKVRNSMRADWDMNTNLEAVFDLILDTATKNHLKSEDLPAKLYIISDMQFDAARSRSGYEYVGTGWNRHLERVVSGKTTFMQEMRKKYEAAGYEMPTIVYWNVRQSKCGMFQQTFEGENCCMVSGYSPSLFKAIIEGTTYEEVEEVVVDKTTGRTVVQKSLKANVNPITVMLTALNNERYDRVWVG